MAAAHERALPSRHAAKKTHVHRLAPGVGITTTSFTGLPVAAPRELNADGTPKPLADARPDSAVNHNPRAQRKAAARRRSAKDSGNKGE
jgi:hypothetical protein